jgi:hypothetical protein
MTKLSIARNHLKACATYGLPIRLRVLNVLHILLK